MISYPLGFFPPNKCIEDINYSCSITLPDKTKADPWMNFLQQWTQGLMKGSDFVSITIGHWENVVRSLYSDKFIPASLFMIFLNWANDCTYVLSGELHSQNVMNKKNEIDIWKSISCMHWCEGLNYVLYKHYVAIVNPLLSTSEHGLLLAETL